MGSYASLSVHPSVHQSFDILIKAHMGQISTGGSDGQTNQLWHSKSTSPVLEDPISLTGPIPQLHIS